ncbi:MAG: O-methyltransferase [Isosphaeraceae bacterium]
MFSERIQAVMDRVDQLRDQVDDHWQIPREEALFLAQLVRIGRCVSICEIGTSYGFSTLHLAAAASEVGGHVHSIDQDPRKTAAATKNLEEAGLAELATLHQGDARQVLASLQPERPLDLVFIDAAKAQCDEYLNAVWPKLAPECLLLTDNTITHAQELAGFVGRLRSLPDFHSTEVPIGNGLELTVRRSRARVKSLSNH